MLKKKRRIGISIDMTPMVDVAFLLLIFFMITDPKTTVSTVREVTAMLSQAAVRKPTLLQTGRIWGVPPVGAPLEPLAS